MLASCVGSVIFVMSNF